MHHTHINIDPLQSSAAFRLEFGLPVRLGDEPTLVLASELDGQEIMEILALCKDGQRAIVLMRLTADTNLREPADIWMWVPADTGPVAMTGYTLWAGKADEALLIVPQDGRADDCFGITAEGLVRLPRVPLGIEASTQAGIERAIRRLSDRLRELPSIRDFKPMAA